MTTKLKLLLLLLTLILIPSHASLAQTAPATIQKYFPDLSWKNYLEKKGAVLCLNYYELTVPDSLIFLEDSEEELDSVFVQELFDYFTSEKNRNRALSWIMEYAQNIPSLKSYLLTEEIGVIIKDYLSPYFSEAELKALNFPKVLDE
jgi:hypothetical protein